MMSYVINGKRVYTRPAVQQTTAPLTQYQSPAVAAVPAGYGAQEYKDLDEEWWAQYEQEMARQISGGFGGAGSGLAGIKAIYLKRGQGARNSLRESLARQYEQQLDSARQYQLNQQQYGLAERGLGLQERTANQQYGLDLQRLNMAQRAYQPRRQTSFATSFQEIPSYSAPLPGSVGSLMGNRAYQRANRLFG